MSERKIRELYAEAEQFSQQLSNKGWVDDRRIEVVDTRSASELFADDEADRPLVVGLFGGTGVGKSSLLNRLAGSDIARTGVVRPTSMEITAYLHNDRQIASLPSGFPADRFAQVHHNNELFIDVMWVDMPDFDSEETQNRDQVTGWLPHIDLLLYVVTPERYKDEEGWRLLIKSGYRHAWLFVMNQWDKGQDIQLDDFRQLLAKAGFDAPLLYRTICGSNTDIQKQDEFNDLADFVAKLAQRNIVTQLEQRGWLQRLYKAKERLQQQIEMLQSAENETTLVQSFKQRWAEFSTSARVNLELPFREYSEQFSENKTAPLASALRSVTGVGVKSAQPAEVAKKIASSVAAKTDVTALWDDWSATRLQDALSQFELAQPEHGVPLERLKRLALGDSPKASSRVQSQLQLELDKAIKQPGSSLQRSAQTVVKHLQWVLPVAMLGWVGYRIVDGFISGAADAGSYVGVGFLVNGGLLVAIAWLIPWVLTKLLTPSIPKAVHKGLHQGLDRGLQISADEFIVRLEQLRGERNSLLEDAVQLHQSVGVVCDKSVVPQLPELEGMVLSMPSDTATKK